MFSNMLPKLFGWHYDSTNKPLFSITVLLIYVLPNVTTTHLNLIPPVLHYYKTVYICTFAPLKFIKMRNLITLLSLFILTIGHSQNAKPVVYNVSGEKTIDGFKVTYSLYDAEFEACHVYLRASLNGGESFETMPIIVTGDVGANVEPGTDKVINWQGALTSLPGVTDDIIFKVIADDGHEVPVQEIAAQFDPERIRENFLKVYGNNSPTNPFHYDQTRRKISEHYQSLGLQTQLDTFFTSVPDTIFPVREGVNVYGTIQGLQRPDSTVLMTGHYDTVEDTPGADDNNMSVAVCMEAARVLKDFEFRNNIRFANWDLEEIGLLGAYYYALSPQGKNTKSVINFDGITLYSEEPGSQKIPTGFDILFPAAYEKAAADDFRGNFIAMITDIKSIGLNQQAVALAPKVAPTLRYIDITCPDPNCLVATDLRRSDHSPFWDRAVPAIFFTSSTEFRSDCYHQPCDTVINLDYSTKVIQLAASLVATQAGIMHAGSDVSEKLVLGVKTNTINNQVKIAMPYPNPVKHSLFIEVELANSVEFSADIFDLTGKKVDTISSRTLNAGKSTIAWVPSRDLPANTYIINIQAGDINESHRILVDIDQNQMHIHGH